LPYFSKCSVRDCSSVDQERPLEWVISTCQGSLDKFVEERTR
jgi:hypothetical protein